MTKQEFLGGLSTALSGLPQSFIEESLSFYEEMIDDRIEDGLSEEDAVADMGSVNEAARQVLDNISIFKLAKEKIKPKRKMRAWEIALLCAGSPVWFPLLVSALAVVFALIASMWAVVISLWAVFGAFVGCGGGGVAAGIILLCTGNLYAGLVLIACGLVLAGLSIFAFFECKGATRGMAKFTKKIALGIKRLLVRKESV